MAEEAAPPGARRPLVEALPELLLSTRVLPLLGAADVLCCARVCKRWLACVECDEVWRALCAHKWRGKARMPFSFTGAPQTPFGKVRLAPDAVDALSIKELKTLLAVRGVPSQRFLEKAEFRRAFHESTPVEVQGLSRLFGNVWKASYAYALRDATRREITPEELTGQAWVFFMKQNAYMCEFKFKPDGRIESNMRGGVDRESRWKFVGYSPRRVQVDEYPPLTVSRRPDDWGFRLENEYVLFYSDHYGADPRALFRKEYPQYAHHP